jgi:hypothetical protein
MHSHLGYTLLETFMLGAQHHPKQEAAREPPAGLAAMLHQRLAEPASQGPRQPWLRCRMVVRDLAGSLGCDTVLPRLLDHPLNRRHRRLRLSGDLPVSGVDRHPPRP